jgi:hypothetical protein
VQRGKKTLSTVVVLPVLQPNATRLNRPRQMPPPFAGDGEGEPGPPGPQGPPGEPGSGSGPASQSVFAYHFSALTTVPPVGGGFTGRVRFNATDPYEVTEVWLSVQTLDGVDTTLALALLAPYTTVYVQQADDPTVFAVFETLDNRRPRTRPRTTRAAAIRSPRSRAT